MRGLAWLIVFIFIAIIIVMVILLPILGKRCGHGAARPSQHPARCARGPSSTASLRGVFIIIPLAPVVVHQVSSCPRPYLGLLQVQAD